MLNIQAVCFGEILWDMLPTGKVAGGAPMNVAFHLNQLGVPTGIISRVGADELGREMTAFLDSKNVPLQWVGQDAHKPTGTVAVALDEHGHPAYDIVQDTAWDHIEVSPMVLNAVSEARAFIFGSLVARGETSRRALLDCIARASFRVFDVNLRKPFFSPQLLRELLLQADLAKMNDEELDIIADWEGITGDQSDKMTHIKDRFGLRYLVMTRGAQGALSLDDSGLYAHPGYKVNVQDTIGSGDAFLAGYLSQLLAGRTPEYCLDTACRMGAFVATQRGGTPVLDNAAFNALSQT